MRKTFLISFLLFTTIISKAQTWAKLYEPAYYHAGTIFEFDNRIHVNAFPGVGIFREYWYPGYLERIYDGVLEKKYAQNKTFFVFNSELYASFYDIENGADLPMKKTSGDAWTSLSNGIIGTKISFGGYFNYNDTLLCKINKGYNSSPETPDSKWYKRDGEQWVPFKLPNNFDAGSVVNIFSTTDYDVVEASSVFIKKKGTNTWKEFVNYDLSPFHTSIGVLNNRFYLYTTDYDKGNLNTLYYFKLSDVEKAAEWESVPVTKQDTLSGSVNYTIKNGVIYAAKSSSDYVYKSVYELNLSNSSKTLLLKERLEDFYIKGNTTYITNSLGLFKSVSGSPFVRYERSNYFSNLQLMNFIATNDNLYTVDYDYNVFKRASDDSFKLDTSSTKPTELFGRTVKISDTEYFINGTDRWAGLQLNTPKNNYSTDGGSTWQKLTIAGKSYTGYLTKNKDTLFLACRDGIFKRANTAWQQISSDFPGQLFCVSSSLIAYNSGVISEINMQNGSAKIINKSIQLWDIISINDNLYAMATIDGYGLYVSCDKGITWKKKLASPGNALNSRLSINSSGDVFYPSSENGFLRGSLNSGSTWTELNTGIYTSPLQYRKSAISVCTFKNKVYTSSLPEGIYNIAPSAIESPYNVTISSTPASIVPGQSIQVGFATNKTFAANNQVSIYLSDSTGTFTSEVQIGSANLNSSGNVLCYIPSNLKKGNHYRVRAKTSDQSITGAESFDDIKAIVNDGVLPLSLISFRLQKEENGVRLIWQTANEKNNHHFEIQHSTDGSSYAIKSSVASNGQGGLILTSI